MNILGSLQSSYIFNNSSSGTQLTGIAGLIAQATVWLDGNDKTTMYNGSTQVTTANGNMTKWLNKNNTSQYFISNAGNTFQWGNTFNTNKSGIKCTNGSAYMSFSNPEVLPYTNYSIFVVCSYPSSGPYACLGIGASATPSNQAQMILAYTNNLYVHSGSAVAVQEYSSNFTSSPYGSNALLTNPFIFEYLKTQGTNDGYYTGTSMTYAKNDATTTGSTQQTFCSLFCHSNNGSFNSPVNSYISEVLIFPTKLSTDDRQKVESYLAFKYGFQSYLPPSHTYKSAPPA